MKGSIPHAKALMAIAGMDKEEPAQVKERIRRGIGSRAGGGARTLSELLLLELRRGSGVACVEKGFEPAKDSK